jgi:hypothetical protein
MLMQGRWGVVKIGVQKNLDTKRGEKPMEMEEYMRCYTAVHTFCTTVRVGVSSSPATFSSEYNKGGGMYVFFFFLLMVYSYRCILEIGIEIGIQSTNVHSSLVVKAYYLNERAA